MKFALPAAVLLGLMTLAPAIAKEPPTVARINHLAWQPREYPISFWCGPPEPFMTPERYAEMKLAGFTFTTPPCTWGGPHGPDAVVQRNLASLKLAAQSGLPAFIADARMPHSMEEKDAAARIDAIVADYEDRPGLAGYSVMDEPSAPALKGLGEVVDYLRRKDPKHPAWINLLPYASGPAWGAASYDDYVKTYLDAVQPFALSYDHYTFTNGGDAPTFIKNLSVMREASRARGIPFWNIVLVTQHGPYRNLTEGEMRYEAMQTLAYGARGLIWFTYWEPQDKSFTWLHAPIHADGSRDPHFDMMRRVNWDLRALGKPLLDADCTDVFHTGDIPDGGKPWTEGLPVRVTGAGSLTVGLFRGAHGKQYAVVANEDYKAAVKTEIAVKAKGRVQQINPLSRKWSDAGAAHKGNEEATVPLELAPGGAALVRW
jgi:hypothetical protein